jgi:hypothetical protein
MKRASHAPEERSLRPQDQAEELRQLVVRELVLRYLAAHPDAMDTVEGIAEWWVAREQLRVDLERLAVVLGRLTTDGVLEEVTVAERQVYRLRDAATRRAP